MEALTEPYSVDILRAAGRIRLIVRPALGHSEALDAVEGLKGINSPVDKLRWRKSSTEYILNHWVQRTEDGVLEAVRLTSVLGGLGIDARTNLEPQTASLSA
jgi:hypothetical protein